ncbi:MAG: ASCH domain-containing protein [Rhodoluna sp.]|nr:ASCH domain-containing protein [Rhodoluna sp.]
MSFPRVGGLRTVEFGNPGESRNEILDCLFNGNKRATAGLVEYDYVAENEPLEHVGEILVVVGNNGEDLGRIKVTSVEVVSFDEVPDEFALAEAEGDLSGDDFRKSHGDFWASCGYDVKPESEVVLVYFDLVSAS